MVYGIRRVTAATLCVAAFIFLCRYVPRLLNPTPPDPEERDRDKHWVNTSPSWIDRQVCRWLGLCGLQHLRWDAPARPDRGDHSMMEAIKMIAAGWSEGYTFVEKVGESDWETAPVKPDLKRIRTSRALGNNNNNNDDDDDDDDVRILNEVPDYVLLHAPLVHLYSGENFWPSDIAEHIQHLRPYQDGKELDLGKPLHLGNLATLNELNGSVFLTSEDDVEWRPRWLHNRVGIPTPFKDDGDYFPGGDGNRQPEPPEDGSTWWDADRKHPPHRIVPPFRSQNHRNRGQLGWRDKTRLQRRAAANQQRPIVGSGLNNKPDSSGYSKAPAVLILVDKGAGILDAFWFFFYSYNLGQTVLKIRFGNHVGDWEHCMVRFQNGIPRAMFLSEHAGGKAYTWHALEKRAQNDGKPPRPVIYSAVGSHAMYANPGLHPYVLPFKLLRDVTDKGPLWDPTLNHYAYWYDYEVDEEESRNGTIRDTDRTSLVPAASNPDLPTSWFHFEGFWGDDVYPLSDRRQWRIFGEYHYITGPLGPKAKWLDRRKVCQTEKCIIVDSIEAGKKSAWY